MKLKNIFLLFLIPATSYFLLKTYHYFFDKHAPTLVLKGIEPQNYYANKLNCTMCGSDAYKIACIDVFLDEQPLYSTKINAATCELPCEISLKDLADGRHVLRVQCTNTIYQAQTTTQNVPFYVDNKPLLAQLINPEKEGENHSSPDLNPEFSGDKNFKIHQGKTFHVQFRVNKPIQKSFVEIFDKQHMCFPESHDKHIFECFVPISCEEKVREHSFYIHVTDLTGETLKLTHNMQVEQVTFKKQALKISNEKIKKEKQGLSNDQLEKELAQLLDKSPQERLWKGVFFAPTEIQGISTEFGTIRITQEKGRYMHKAIDIINLPKSVVWAPHNGIVVIKDRYALSGNTVVIDHGFGIFSLLYHLDNFAENIEVGMRVQQGNPIGTLGNTGYASGYHLHWEMRINNIAIDPLQWTDQQFLS